LGERWRIPGRRAKPGDGSFIGRDSARANVLQVYHRIVGMAGDIITTQDLFTFQFQGEDP
jgi:hypothetical protein